jgi:hypothetical protein
MKKSFLMLLIGFCLCSPCFAQSSCSALQVAELAGFKSELASMRNWSDLDNTNHGITGAYATASQSQNGGIIAAQKKLDEFIDWNQKNVGTALVNYAQAYVWNGYCDEIEKALGTAAHWGAVSAAHHKSKAAYEVVIASYQLQAKLVQLRIKCIKCYMDAYVVPER